MADKTPTGLLLADVAYEVFTEEIIPLPFMDETSAVFSRLVQVAPVVRLTRLPLPAGKQQGAIKHKINRVSSKNQVLQVRMNRKRTAATQLVKAN